MTDTRDFGMENLKYFAAFGSNEVFSASFVRKLYDYFDGDIESAWNVSAVDLYNIEGLTKRKITSFLETRDKINPDKELQKLLDSEISLLTFDDEEYPKLLRQIHDAPMWLYYMGNKSLFNAKYNMAVVGSRKCSSVSNLS